MNLETFVQRCRALTPFDLGGRRFNGYASVLDRLAAGIDVREPDECWPWRHAIRKQNGYARFMAANRPRQAHRLVYELLVGPIPDDMDVDHTCHNTDPTCVGGRTCLHRRCMNPRHLEAVTRRVNVLRGKGIAATRARITHCPQGHPYDEANTRLSKNNERSCKACAVAEVRRWRARQRIAGSPL